METRYLNYVLDIMLLKDMLNVKSGQHSKSRKHLFYKEIFSNLEIQRQDMKTKPMFSLNS